MDFRKGRVLLNVEKKPNNWVISQVMFQVSSLRV